MGKTSVYLTCDYALHILLIVPHPKIQNDGRGNMTQSSSSGSHSISFLDTREFLGHDPSHGRLDKLLDSNVTLSAIPDASGGTQWEALTPEGEALPLFHLTIRRPAERNAAGPVFIDSADGCYICYEDHIRMESRCVQIPC